MLAVSDNAALSEDRTVDDEAFDAFARRIVRAYGRRIGDGNVAGLVGLVRLSEAVDQAMQAAVDGLRADPWDYSWGDIARNLGVSRQAVRQRWGSPRSDR